MYTDWLWLSLVSIQKLRLIIKTCQSLGSLFSRLNSWNKVHSHIFDLPIIFLKRLIIKPFGKITLWTFTLGTLVWWLYTNFSFKTGLQISAIVPSTEPKKIYKDVRFPATASAYLSRYGGCKNIFSWLYSMTVPLINKIDCM